MQKKFTIQGIGICYGQLRGCEAFAEAMIAGAAMEGCASADASDTAIREALQHEQVSGLTVISNMALSLDVRKAFGFENLMICKDWGEMIAAADERVLLVAGNEKGTLAVLLTQEDVGFANFSIQGECKEKDDAVEMLLQVITAALEIRYALCLREAPSEMYRFWDSEEKRKTAISCGSLELVFTEPNTFCSVVYKTSKYLLPVVFTTVEEAQNKLRQLKISAAGGLYPAMKACFAQLSQRTADTNTIVLAAENKTELAEEIDGILLKSDKLLEDGFVWRTKRGSLYIRRSCADPKIVFMNPPGGMFNAKVFYHLFLKLYGTMKQASRFVTDKHYTGSEDNFLSRTLFDMVVNYIVTMLLEDIGITPDILSGVCQGELSIIFTHMKSKNGAIKDMRKYTGAQLKKTIEMATRGDNQPLEDYLGRKIDKFTKYYLKHDLDAVRKVVEKYDSVFMWEIGSVKDVMIEGEAASCQKVIEELGCMATELADPLYVHTPIMEECRQEIHDCIRNAEIYMDVEHMPFRIFSTYYMEYLTSESEMLADNLAHLIVDEVDYSKVPKALYGDGARIFIDLSPIQLCNTWTRTTLQKSKDAQILSIYGNEAADVDLCSICAAMLAGNVRFEHEKLLSKLSFADDTVVTELEVKQTKQITDAAQTMEKSASLEEKRDIKPKEQIKIMETETITKQIEPVEKTTVSKEPTARNMEEWKQYLRRQMAINEEVFRLYTNAQNALYEQMLSAIEVSAPSETKKKSKTEQKPCLWNREQVITMTDSSMAAVLGDAYQVVDQYPVRARMPLPPFLFVSRITEIDAEFGVLRPGRIVAEYDFDEDCVFRIGDTNISSCVAAEASHIGIFLMGYMGLDAMSNGTLSFRALDCNQTYLSDKLFHVGDTMRTVFTIHRFAQNGPTTILYYDYETWNGDTLVSRSEAAGGFFTQAELASNKGVLAPKVFVNPLEPKTLLHYGTTDQAAYTPEQITAFYRGDAALCFGADTNLSEGYYLHQKHNMQMLERILKIDYNGGKYGRGFISGEKDITPDLWPFDVHFKNDPVFPGIIMIDGVTQIEIFLLAQTGVFSQFKSAQVRMITNQPIVTKFRGQVRRGNSTLRYELHIKESKMCEDGYYLTTDAAIFNNEIQVISIESFGMKVVGERLK